MSTLAFLISKLIGLLQLLIIIRAVLGFLPQVDRYHPLVRFLHTVTDPILAPFQRILPGNAVGIDFSPLLAILTLQAIDRLLMMALHSMPI
ncbi:MAG: YggT family protein [Candidatus Sericytochromatia bacterium]|nr:YggT family protein [Candidatus Sericytochromatia bacterium]